jgi:hypothetical protein
MATSTPLPDDDFLFLPVDQVTAPEKGLYFQLYANAWWAVHAERGLVFFNPKSKRTGRRRFSYLGAPQCNVIEKLARGVSRDHLPFEVEIRQFPVVFVPVNLSDYK